MVDNWGGVAYIYIYIHTYLFMYIALHWPFGCVAFGDLPQEVRDEMQHDIPARPSTGQGERHSVGPRVFLEACRSNNCTVGASIIANVMVPCS